MSDVPVSGDSILILVASAVFHPPGGECTDATTVGI